FETVVAPLETALTPPLQRSNRSIVPPENLELDVEHPPPCVGDGRRYRAEAGAMLREEDRAITEIVEQRLGVGVKLHIRVDCDHMLEPWNSMEEEQRLDGRHRPVVLEPVPC